jgi:hypothetical protein
LGLFRELEGCLSAGDVLLADALYCNYFLIARMQTLGVDVVFEQHGSRLTDFRCGERLGVRDHLVWWKKPKTRPQWMSKQEYANSPRRVRVREVKVGGRVLVTSMLEPGELEPRESVLVRFDATRLLGLEGIGRVKRAYASTVCGTTCYGGSGALRQFIRIAREA